MSKAGRISDDFVKRLTPPQHGQRIYWDDKIDGFGVRINAGGSKTFVLNYTINRTRRRCKIGRFSVDELSAMAARKLAGEMRVNIDNGIDPMQRRQPSTEPTFKDLCDRYLTEYAETEKRASSVRNDRYKIKWLLERWSDRTVASFTSSDIQRLKTDLKATPISANRHRSLLSKMFNLAVEWGYRTDNPAKGIQKFIENKSDKYLTEDEIARLLRACDSYHDQNAANAIRLLLLTGSRPGEVLNADWKQFDLKRGIWTKLSHSTKQKKTEHVPLNRPALALLKHMHSQSSSGWLFPGRVKFNDGARVTLRRPWTQLCKAAGLSESVERKGKKRTITRYKPTVSPYVLRHTFVSQAIMKGASLYEAGKLVGHTQSRTTERYAHLANETLQKATNLFGDLVGSLSEQK